MAYVPDKSLRGVIDRLRCSNNPRARASEEILRFAYNEVECLAVLVKRAFGRRESRLVPHIKDAASVLRKALQIFYIINLEEEIHSFSEKVKKMEATMEEYAHSSRIGSNAHKSKMVGFHDLYREITDSDMVNLRVGVFRYVSICGMGGIGKTTLAKKYFDGRLSLGIDFDCRAWVTVGRNPEFEEIIRSILHQVNPDSEKGVQTRLVVLGSNSVHPNKKRKKNPDSDEMLMEAGDENISEYLKDTLRGWRCLIVLDDVWDEWVMKEMDSLLQDDLNLSVLLTTTRLETIAHRRCSFANACHLPEIELLDKEESWNLLREKVFGAEPCPFQLEEAGKKIAEHCDGLPLTIVTVASLLSQEEKTLQYWNEVAQNKNHPLFMAAYDEISEVLRPSYEHLSQILQMCFLYMGVFPQRYEITRSKLFNLWYTDGFFQQNVDKFSNDNAVKCLSELVSNSLVMSYRSRSINCYLHHSYKETIKTCGLHSSLWHLSYREAGKTKFHCVLNSLNDGLGEGIERQCRLSFHNNVLLGIKEVYESVEDNCASTVHSLLFYGPYHQYQVPICFGLKLLKQLNAFTIRFYEFPMEILQLIQLRYLAVTVNGNLPASISQLSNLQFLIVGRHMSIKSYTAPSYLPVEIWDMKELQHLQVTGCDLPNHPGGTSLKRLSSLSNVSPLSCTEGIFKAIPNLEKLGIRIELVPDGDGKSLSYFDHIFHLEGLKSLKCVVENPEFASPLAPLSIFSSCLEKLSLSGLGYSWEEMSKLSSLPCLKVLKLQNYAFRGPKWEVENRGFSSLIFLAIEDTDLEEWNIGGESFPKLCCLRIKHCYKLEKIHGNFADLGEIELVDCKPSFVTQIKKFTFENGKNNINYSWNDGN